MKIKPYKIDRWCIVLLPIIISIGVCWWLDYYIDLIFYDINIIDGKGIIVLMLGIWATLLGFLITAQSILITFDGSGFVDRFKQSEHYTTVIFSYMVTCIALFLCMVTFLPILIMWTWNKLVLLILVFALVLSMLLLAICILWLFLLIYSRKKL